VLGRSDDANREFEEEATPLGQSGAPARGYTDVGDAVAGVLRAAEEAAEKIKAEAQTQAGEIVERAKGDASTRVDELTREAERTRREAEDYARDIRQAVDSYGTQQRRESEEEARGILADAEEQARATREAAQEIALQIEGDARRRQERLREEVRSLEERRQRVVESLREMAAQLNDLFPELEPRARENEMLDALEVERRS
jgi:vacuolar-type H+-ATPase subunit H